MMSRSSIARHLAVAVLSTVAIVAFAAPAADAVEVRDAATNQPCPEYVALYDGLGGCVIPVENTVPLSVLDYIYECDLEMQLHFNPDGDVWATDMQLDSEWCDHFELEAVGGYCGGILGHAWRGYLQGDLVVLTAGYTVEGGPREGGNVICETHTLRVGHGPGGLHLENTINAIDTTSSWAALSYPYYNMRIFFNGEWDSANGSDVTIID